MRDTRAIERQRRSVCIFIGVEEDVCSIVFVVAEFKYESRSLRMEWKAHSLAQRYGSKARILGRAQVSKLKADFFIDMVEVGTIFLLR